MSTQQDALSRFGLSSNGSEPSDNSLRFRDRVMKLFKATDFVRVKNIDDEAFSWVYTDPRDEVVDMPDRYTRHVQFGQPRVTTLEPGESRVILGGEAFVMIEQLFKHYIQKHNDKVSTLMSDPLNQEKYIKQIFMGIEDPMSVINNQSTAPEKPVETVSAVNEDLGLTDVKTTRPRGRTAKAKQS